MKKSIKFTLVSSLLLSMVTLMGCPPQAIDVPVPTGATSAPASTVPTDSGSVAPTTTPTDTGATTAPSSSTATTAPSSSTATAVPTTVTATATATPTATGVTPTPSSTPFGTPTPTASTSSGGGGGSSSGGGGSSGGGSSFPAATVSSVSLPTTDATFVSYTITGTNFFVGSTTLSSLYYTPPATLATASAAASDTLTIEKLQSQGITLQATESTDANATLATASLVDSTHIKVKIPRALFTSGFDFTQIRVGSTTTNPATAQSGPIGGGGLTS